MEAENIKVHEGTGLFLTILSPKCWQTRFWSIFYVLNTIKLKVRAPEPYEEAGAAVDDEVLLRWCIPVQGSKTANWREACEHLYWIIRSCLVISESYLFSCRSYM